MAQTNPDAVRLLDDLLRHAASLVAARDFRGAERLVRKGLAAAAARPPVFTSLLDCYARLLGRLGRTRDADTVRANLAASCV